MDSKISSFVLPNGLTVVSIYKPYSPNVSFSLRLMAGSIYEKKDEIGVAHFLEHIVFDGTEKYPDEKKLAELIDERGGYRNGITSRETVEYVVKVLREDADVGFEYLSQIASSPLMRENDIEKQKKIIEQEIYRFKSDPMTLAPRLIYSAIFPNTRLEALSSGDVEDIAKISRDSIHGYFSKTHVAKNMVLCVSGNISEEVLRGSAEKYFVNISSGHEMGKIDIDVPMKDGQIVSKVPGLKQSTLAIGYSSFQIRSAHRYAADLISAILTKGKSSRLVYEIREKRAMAYAVNSSNYSGRNFGAFVVQVGLAQDKVPECQSIILNEIKRLSTETLSSAELAKAISFIKANMAFSFENSLAEASYYSGSWCATGNIVSVEKEISNYGTVNPLEILETAKLLFSKKPAILTILA